MATTPVLLQNNPGISGTGSIALVGECWDQSGNKIGNGSIVLRIIGGAIATIAITNTLMGGTVGALAFAGNAPSVTPGTVVARAPLVGAAAIAGVAPTVSVS